MVIEEWVEVRGRTIELALQVALEELKLSSADEAEVEVVQEPQKGFLGLGGRDAVIKVKPKPKKKRRRRRRSRSKGGGDRQEPSGSQAKKPKDQGRSRSESGSSRQSQGRARQERAPRPAKTQPSQEPTEDHMDVESQAQIIKGFLDGLLEAFGLEGDVETRIDDGVIYADVTGEQTEALVGPKGAIMQAIQELTRTVVQRQSRDSARIRLDVAGYGERRRSALKIYTARLAEQVLGSGREAVLEPMNPSDRKVVHDVVAEIEGVRSYSEGEEPHRSVVVGLAPGYEPPAAEEDAGDDGAEPTTDEAVDTEEQASTAADGEATADGDTAEPSDEAGTGDDSEADTEAAESDED